MATEVIQKQWCDVHLNDHDERVEAGWSGVVRVSDVTRHLDLCDDHYKEIIGSLPELVEKYGNAVDPKTMIAVPRASGSGSKKAPDADGLACPICGKDYTYRQSLSQHTRKIHGISIRELDGKPPPEALGPVVCGIDGCTFEAAAPPGLGAHRRAKHGVEGSSPSTRYWRETHGTAPPPLRQVG